jgi:hypothetical protein
MDMHIKSWLTVRAAANPLGTVWSHYQLHWAYLVILISGA